MNIFGRVFGGLLVLISLGWLASIAGIRPGGLASNQIDSKQPTGTTDLNAPKQTGATSTDGKTPASTAKPGTRVGASTFTTGQVNTTGQPATGKPEVEDNPRGVSNGTPAVGQNTPTTETAPVATPPKAAPVQAGW